MIFNSIFVWKNIFAGIYILFVIINGHNPFTETLQNNNYRIWQLKIQIKLTEGQKKI